MGALKYVKYGRNMGGYGRIWAPFLPISAHMGKKGAHIAHILFFGVPILAAAHMGVPSIYGNVTWVGGRIERQRSENKFTHFFFLFF